MALHRELCVGYYLMETVAADLKAGDALVVNAANGAVGQAPAGVHGAKVALDATGPGDRPTRAERAPPMRRPQVVIQLCRLMNIRAIAITRRHDNFSDTKAWLEFLGAYKVFADDEPIVPALQREYASLPRLAFDGVGGVGTLKLIRSLAPGSTIVSYGFVGERAAAIPWQVVVHARVTIKGFDLLFEAAPGKRRR